MLKLRRSRKEFAALFLRGLWPVLILPAIAFANIVGLDRVLDPAPSGLVTLATWLAPFSIVALLAMLLRPVVIIKSSCIRWRRTESGPAGHLMRHSVAEVSLEERNDISYLQIYGGSPPGLQIELAVQLDRPTTEAAREIRETLGL